MFSPKRLLGALWLFVSVTSACLASPPTTVAFQGALTDPSGNPKPDGSYTVTFRLYDAATGGTDAWTESKSVTVAGGAFATALGDTTAFPSTVTFGDKAWWVSVQVGTDAEMAPRLPLRSVPYALALPNVTVASDGKVGIGTTSPASLLDVAGDVNAQNNVMQGGTPINTLFALRAGSNATGTWPIGISGSAPAAQLSGIVPVARGGTGIATGPTAPGEYLRSTGPGAWSAGPIPAGDVPSLAGLYVDLTSNQTNIGGIKSFTNKVGVRNTSPLYALDVTGVIRTTGGLIFGDGTIQLSAGWALSGNSNTIPGTHFVGTTDNKALEVKVNATRALRIEPTAGAANIVGGFSGNTVTPAATQGAFIGGGGQAASVNKATEDYSAIVGGHANQAGNNDGDATNRHDAFVGGGDFNTASGAESMVGGGSNNTASGWLTTIGGGLHNTASGDRSTIAGGEENLTNFTWAAIVGGYQNQATNDKAFVGGGNNNKATGPLSGIVAGDSNIATDSGASVGGGQNNTAGNVAIPGNGSFATVAGGRNNTASGSSGAIGGGQFNTVSGPYSVVAGGASDTASGNWSAVGGGQGNTASGKMSTVPGGAGNTAAGDYSFAAGWLANAAHSGAYVWADSINAPFASTGADQYLIRASGGVGINTNAPAAGVALDVNGTIRSGAGGFMFPNGTVQTTAAAPTALGWALLGNTGTNPGVNYVGTTDNVALELRVNKARALRLEPNATSPNLVGGEATNSVSSGAAGATVGGGGSAASPNTVSDDFGTISGGQANLAGDNAAPTNSAPGATVGGGGFNVAAQRYATVAGGQENQAIAPWASVGGGYLNVAPGQWATIPGGEENLAPGTHAFAAGYKAQAMLPGTFVWSDDSIAAPFPAMAPQEFSARATGGVRFVSAVNAAGIPTAGVILPPGGNAWLALSDRTAKENVRCVDGREVLEALAGVPMSTWNYQTQDPAIRHMGPMAQDFSAAFGVGEDDTHISTIDADGVALAAIQGLYQIVQEQQQRIRTLEARIAALEGVSGAVRVPSPEAP